MSQGPLHHAGLPVDQAQPRVRNSDLPPRGETIPEAADFVGVNLRCKAIARMVKMNAAHARQAWQRRRRDPLSPYALAFLYIHPGPPPFFDLAARTRVWFAEPETTHLPQLLYDLNDHIKSELRSGLFDPRTHLANEPETADPMPPGATYYGLGLSSLDTDSGTWTQVCQTAPGEEHVPGEMTIALTDGTVIVCRRRAKAEYHQCHVFSNHPIEVAAGRGAWPCKVAPAEEIIADKKQDVVDARKFLLALHSTLYSAEFARLNRQTSGTPVTQEPRHAR